MFKGTFSLSQMNNVELARTLSWRENALFEKRRRTFSLSQMNNVELARTLSWRENALLEEREKNVFVKPNEQCRACSNIVMARKHTFRGTKKKVNSMPKWGDARCFRAGNVRMKAQ